MRRAAALLALLLVVLSGATTALAVTPRASFSDVEDELMCVTCGVPLPLAESPQAERERQQVRDDIAAGMTKAQIKKDLVSIYGDRVLAKPSSSGVNILVYVIPIALAVSGLVMIAVLVPRWRASRRATDASASDDPRGGAPSDEDAERLAADLARYQV